MAGGTPLRKATNPWLGLTTAFRFRCGISTSTTYRTIGRHSSTIFSGIGQQMTNTPTLILCAMAFVSTVQHDAVTRGGGASQKKEPERSLCSTSTCLAQWQSPPMPGCLGYGISAYTCPACTSGLLVAGMSRRDDQSWQKSIHLSGAAASRERIGTNISMTPFPWRNGCVAQTLTVHSRVSWLPLSRLQSAKQRTLRAGYWELDEPARSRQPSANDPQ